MSRICTTSAQSGRPEWCVPRIVLPAVSAILTSFSHGDVCARFIRRSQTHINSHLDNRARGWANSPWEEAPPWISWASCRQPVSKVQLRFLSSELVVWPWVSHLISLDYVSSFVRWGQRCWPFPHAHFEEQLIRNHKVLWKCKCWIIILINKLTLVLPTQSLPPG